MGKLLEKFNAFINKEGITQTDEHILDKYVDEEIEKMMALQKNQNPIKDPKEEKEIKAKLKREMKLCLREAAKLDENEKDKKSSVKESTTQDKKENVKENEDRKIDPNNIGYQDRLSVLHAMKMKMYEEQKNDQRGVVDLKHLETILRREKNLLEDVAKLPEDSEEKQAFKAQKEKYINEELEAKKKAEEMFNERTRRFENLVSEVASVKESMESLADKFDEGNITYEEFEKRNSVFQDELQKYLEDIDDLQPNELIEDAKALEKRNIMEAKILGGDHRTKSIKEASSKELATKIKLSHEKDNNAKYTIESNEKYFQLHCVYEIVETLKKNLNSLKEEKDKLKLDIDKGKASYDDFARYIDLSEQVAVAENELEQYDSLDESLSQRGENDAEVIAKTHSEMDKEKDITSENYKEVREKLDDLGEEVGNNSLENPEDVSENNNLSPAERLEKEVRSNLGLDKYEETINEEEVKKRSELKEALEKAEREAELNGEKIRK